MGRVTNIVNSTKNNTHHLVKWDDKFYLKIYLYAAQGIKKTQIAKMLGVQRSILLSWLEKYPAAKEAYTEGRKKATNKNENNFLNYVNGKLSPQAKKLWEKLKVCRDNNEDVELLLADTPKWMRQNLFLHALVSSNFNASRACKRTNVNITEFARWRADPEFKTLLEEIHQHKKDFFEEALVKQVKNGDVSCILFANRTVNKDRGYGDKTQVEITGNIQHNHQNLLNLDELDLPTEILQVILEQVRKKREAAKLAERQSAGVLEYVMSDGKAVPEGEGEKNGNPVLENAKD